MIKNTIKQIHSEISSLQKNTNLEYLHYIFLDETLQNNFFVKYWTTRGSLANGIRVGTQLSSLTVGGHNFFGNAFFVTASVGGAAPACEREQIAQFKYLLSARGRIVTNHDIRTFCLSQYPELIKDVRIKHGVSPIKSHNKHELIRTIDIYLIASTQIKEKETIIENIYNLLVKYSPMTFNYRIFID